LLPKVKRSKLEVYKDVLGTIDDELVDGEAKPAQVQAKSNFAPDRLVRYLVELQGRDMITIEPLTLTSQGREFLQDYGRIKGFLGAMGVKYRPGQGEGAPMSRSRGYRPARFLDRLQGNKHVVLLYDDEGRADSMAARYFLNGIRDGGSCVYFTDEDHGRIRSRLEAQGLEAGRYESEKRLKVFTMPSPGAGEMDVMAALKAVRATATEGMRPPFRFAGKTIVDTESVDGMLRGMAVEKTENDNFDEFDSAQLCFYDIGKMEPTRRNEWVEGLLGSHGSVVYASDPDRAVAFDTDLLQEEEQDD
jgi:predicted transcriptional regulator